MLNNLTLGSYYPVNSKIHFMNPFSKVICSIIYLVSLFLCRDPYSMLTLTLFAFLMIELSHLPKSIYFLIFKKIRLIMILIMLIAYLLNYDFDTIVIILIGFYNFLLYITMITITTPPTDLIIGFRKVLTPLKIVGFPVDNLAIKLSFAIRFIPIMMEENLKIMRSQASRGLDYYASNILGKFIILSSKLGPLFMLTFRRFQKIKQAMNISLFNLKEKRSSFVSQKWSFFDTYLFVLHIGMIVLLITRMVLI